MWPQIAVAIPMIHFLLRPAAKEQGGTRYFGRIDIVMAWRHIRMKLYMT
ncbi:hypothetical protein GXY_03868 [Novacetimonas hansenii ATCC 23769]|uniref:Uncharacterized protein n=1 Tax=Novacetimonas hansenii ATCC 23769 TaxID=714995 RepID=D5QCC1_NOVHA|nr:hypothetical protein GXY_03868 [Novacetimonas hansenii ATCC 23769]